jgi:hypothetical protein
VLCSRNIRRYEENFGVLNFIEICSERTSLPDHTAKVADVREFPLFVQDSI